jgi:hypothetical protein
MKFWSLATNAATRGYPRGHSSTRKNKSHKFNSRCSDYLHVRIFIVSSIHALTCAIFDGLVMNKNNNLHMPIIRSKHLRMELLLLGRPSGPSPCSVVDTGSLDIALQQNNRKEGLETNTSRQAGQPSIRTRLAKVVSKLSLPISSRQGSSNHTLLPRSLRTRLSRSSFIPEGYMVL